MFGLDRRRQRLLAIGALIALLSSVFIFISLLRAELDSQPEVEVQMFRSLGAVVGNSLDKIGEKGSGQEGFSGGPAAGPTRVSAITVTPKPLPHPTAAAAGGSRLAGRVVCIDAGHASNTNSGIEPIGPGATETKTTEPGGTSGVVSGVPEHQVTLAIALKLKPLLEAEGARVVMVREGEVFYGLARDRTLIANREGSDLYLRIHCDGSEDQSAHGASTLYPASVPGWTDDIAVASRNAAAGIQSALVGGLGVPDLGIVERSDMLGFNWSDVPVVLAEVGFLTNPDEDRRLTAPEYQQQVARALATGVAGYLTAPR